MDSILFDYPDESSTPESSTGRADTALLPAMDAAGWALIREHAPARRFRAGDVVVAAGEVDRCLWIVVDGRVQVTAEHRAGRDIHGWLGPGEVFGELSFLTGEPADTTVRAESKVTALRLSLAQFEVLAAKDAALGRHLLFGLGRVLALRLRDLRRLA